VDGIVLIDKPEGMTSAAVVRAVKKLLAADKVGHLGTLDPFAGGLLPVCVGAGAKVAQFLAAERKAYTGTIRLGVETDTLDATGAVLRTAAVAALDEVTLRDLERRFSGECWQIPPMYSALKRNGVPLYRLARKGVEVERAPRKVLIEELRLSPVAPDLLSFSLLCSTGTYVRSLAADLGAAVGCGAHLATLRRTKFGHFSLDDAVPLGQVPALIERGGFPLLSLRQALRHCRALVLSAEGVAQVRRGQQAGLQDLPGAECEGEAVQLIAPDGELVAVAREQGGRWQLARVFSTLH